MVVEWSPANPSKCLGWQFSFNTMNPDPLEDMPEETHPFDMAALLDAYGEANKAKAEKIAIEALNAQKLRQAAIKAMANWENETGTEYSAKTIWINHPDHGDAICVDNPFHPANQAANQAAGPGPDNNAEAIFAKPGAKFAGFDDAMNHAWGARLIRETEEGSTSIANKMNPPAPPKQRRKNRKSIEEEGAKLPGKRVSYAGYCYADSTEGQWIKCEPIGWVHESEQEAFQSKYLLCISPASWHMAHECERLYIMGRVAGCVLTEKMDQSAYFRCSHSQCIVPINEAVQVWNDHGETSNVSKIYIKDEHLKDTITNRYYSRHSFVRIEPNNKGMKTAHRMNAVDAGIIKQCTCCEKWFIADQVTENHDAEGWIGSPICNGCYNKVKNKGVIRPHNHKQYQAPIVEPRYVKLGGYATEVENVRMFGVEVELEFDKPSLVKAGLDRFVMARKVKDALGKDFIEIKEDGSLTMNGKYNGAPEFDVDGTKNGKLYAGFEAVSCPACIETHRKRWMAFEKMAEFAMLRAWDTETCGLHVHVSRDSLTLLQIGRMLAFVNHPSNRHFIQKIAGRGDSKYCKNHSKKLSDSLHPEYGDHDEKRRVAVNVQNLHTIEFRIFRGTVRACHIIRNIEFVDAMCDYCYPASRAFKELFTPFGFIDFAMNAKTHTGRKWPILAHWLDFSGLAAKPVSNKPVKKSASAPVAIPVFAIEKDLDTQPLKVAKTNWDAMSGVDK